MIKNKRRIAFAISLISILTFQSQAMDITGRNVFQVGDSYLEFYFSGTSLALIPTDLYSALRQYHEAKQQGVIKYSIDGQKDGALDELKGILRGAYSTKAPISLSLENLNFSGTHMLEAIVKDNPEYLDQVVGLKINEIDSYPYVFGKNSYFKNLASLDLRNIKKSRSEIFPIIMQSPLLQSLTSLCVQGVIAECNFYGNIDPMPHLKQNLVDSLPNLKILTIYFSNGLSSSWVQLDREKGASLKN